MRGRWEAQTSLYSFSFGPDKASGVVKYGHQDSRITGKGHTMALVGSLLDISLIDLLQTFSMSGKTGKVILEQGDKYGGMLWIVDGSVANAATIELETQAPMYMGEEAVIEMLQWDDAKFRFVPTVPGETYKVTIKRPTEWLILEGLRWRDEQVDQKKLPQLTSNTRLRLLAHPDSAGERHNLNNDEWAVLKHSANAKTIGQVLMSTGFPESEVYAIIGRLMALRLIDLEQNRAQTAVFAPGATGMFNDVSFLKNGR